MEDSSFSSYSFPEFSARNVLSYTYCYSGEGIHRAMTTEFFLDGMDSKEPQHFLDTCNFCKKPLGSNHDIYMYRGDMPFCSQECRQERIEMDEAMEKSLKLSSLRDMKKSSASIPPTPEEIHVRAGTVEVG